MEGKVLNSGVCVCVCVGGGSVCVCVAIDLQNFATDIDPLKALCVSKPPPPLYTPCLDSLWQLGFLVKC